MTVRWYNGDTAAAVAEAKKQHASLMVFVAWDEEFTKMYEKILDSLDFSNKVYVAIRLAAYSDAFEQLKAIYRIVPVPCVLVIDGESGMVMERVAGPTFDEELQELLLDALPNCPPQEPPKKEATPPPVVEEKPVQTKIQFKLPSGESKTQVFTPDDTLGSLRREAASLFNLKVSFDLAVPYPRRALTSDQDTVTLTALALCPASTVLVIPHEGGSILPWGILQSLGRLIHPILAFLRGYWQQFFGGGPAPPRNSSGSGSTKKAN